MADTQKLPLTERYAFELGRKRAILDIGNLISMRVSGKKVDNINSNDLGRMATLRIIMEVMKAYYKENAEELLEITEEAKKIVENKDVKKNN